MGNQVASRGLERLAVRASHAVVEEYVLAAPDVDAGEFEQLAREISQAGTRMTLYAHSDDKALNISEAMRAGMPRAGDVDDGQILLVDGVDSIDASRLNADFLDHSYFADHGDALADIGRVLDGEAPEDRPRLEAVAAAFGDEFWRFR